MKSAKSADHKMENGSDYTMATSGTLQEVWAAAVYKIAELFVTAWAGIRVVWTRGVNFLYEKWIWVAMGDRRSPGRGPLRQ